MARMLKTPGSNGGHAQIKAAEFDGILRDGATFKIDSVIADGDMILFKGPNGISSGINLGSDHQGLHALINIHNMMLRIGIEQIAPGMYAFRPAPQHIILIPALAENGEGVPINNN